MKEFFKKYNIKNSDKIIITCSGGSDSMFLVEKIYKIHPKENIIIAHFNHQLRGDESIRDEEFVRNYCNKKGLTCEIGTANIKQISTKNKVGIEEGARIERYKFFENISNKYKSKFIFTAHHLNDSIETFIFNLIRGTRLNGLSGIDEQNGKILRPLLKFTKNEILEKCSENNIEFIEDSTNLEDEYLRNHIRLNIIPEFSKINPNYEKSFFSIFEYFIELKEFIGGEVENLIVKNSELEGFSGYFEINKFSLINNLLQKELISKIFKITNNGTIGLSGGNISEVIKFIFDKGNHTKKDIKNMKLFKKNGKVYFN